MKYFTVGPSQMHFDFEKYLKEALKKDIPSISHRSPQFTELYFSLTKNLLKIFKAPKDYSVVFLGSGTEFMERTIQNLSSRETLHFVGGAFAGRCAKFAQNAGRNVTVVQMEKDGSYDLDKIPKGANPELVFLTHSETSSGTMLPKKFIEEVIKLFPNAVFACDIVSSAPVSDIPVSKLDVIFFSVQKGFGLPAGLSVGLLSQRAIDQAKKLEDKQKGKNIFHSYVQMSEYAKLGKTKETPNVLLMFLLNKVLENYLKTGLSTLRAKIKKNHKLLSDTLLKITSLDFSQISPKWRSETVLVANTPNGSEGILGKLKKKGVTIATGYGKEKNEKIRIANFPQFSDTDIKNLIKRLLSLK